ncbi:MAG: hypothetical protein JXR25_01670 [Pontiellaceae bacterium]|nr:hypothetical protein [Pontiellaceae bacterium]MBN2783508.1 hypothetical protein [Pontiellaceae bacterium]
MKRGIYKQVAVMVVAVAGVAQAAVIEKPVGVPGTMVSVTASDLHGLIDGVGAVAASVSPMANGMMLKNLLGAQFNDPGLMAVPAGKGLAVVIVDQTNFFGFVELTESHAAGYSSMLEQNGLKTKYVDGVMVVGKDASQLEKGVGMISSVKSSVLAKRSPTLRLCAEPAWAYEQNKQQVDSMLQMIPMMMGMNLQQAPGMDPAALQGTMRILEGEIRALVSIAKQCEKVEIVLDPSNGALRISETLLPKEGSRMAALLNAPKMIAPNPRVQARMLGDAAIALDGTLSNPEALTTFFFEEIKVILAEMGLAADSMDEMNAEMKKWMDLYGGSFCESIDLGGENFVSVNYAIELKEGANPLAAFKSMSDDMAPFLELYEGLGMPMKMEFVENAREYKGVKVHQFKVNLDMPGDQMEAAAMMNMNLSNMVYDVAVCDNLMLYSMGGSGLDAMVDRVKDAEYTVTPLKARTVYPANGFYYSDIDIGKYMAGISKVMPADAGNPLPQIAGMLQGAEPITSAGFTEDGMMMWSVNVPGSLLGRVGQAVMMMQMQQMSQPMPGAMPMEVPSALPMP